MSRKPTWLDAVGHQFALTRAAWKALPSPGQLYPPQQSSGGPHYLTFPGWPTVEAQANNQDEQRVRKAIQSPSVFANMRAIATELSTAELIVKERKGSKLEDIENHPLELLWEAPNPDLGRSFVMEFWAWSYTLPGKAYLYWLPAGGKIQEIWPIPPFMIKPVPDTKEFVGGYVFKARPDSKPIPIPKEYITYSHSVNIFDIRDSLSFLVAGMTAAESEIAMNFWNRNFFDENNGIPDGMISVGKDVLDVDLQRIREELRAFFGGTKRGLAIARETDMKYQAWGRTQKDAEFIEGIRLQSTQIGRLMGFPDGYWSESANRANAEQARATMIAGAVWPLLVRLSEDMNAGVVKRWYGDGLRAEFKDIRPQDRALAIQEMESRKTHWTINELREADGKDPLDDPRGDMLIKELEKGAPLPATPASDATEEAISKAEEEAGIAPEGEEGMPVEDGAVEETDAPIGDASSLPPAELKTYPVVFADPNARYREEQKLFRAREEPDVMDATSDLLRWERKALKSLRRFHTADVRFESNSIPLPEQARIKEALKTATSADLVRLAFKAKEDALSPDERALADALASVLEQYQGEITKAAESGNVARLTPLGDALGSVLSTALRIRFDQTDGDRPDGAAEGWVNEYVPGLIKGLNETTAGLVKDAIAAARAGASQEETARRLAVAFSPSRAEAIAITELTRASSQATSASQTYLAGRGIPSTQIWRTGNDEHTCAICGPRNGAKQGEGWDDPPPAHPRCRCFTTLEVLR